MLQNNVDLTKFLLQFLLLIWLDRTVEWGWSAEGQLERCSVDSDIPPAVAVLPQQPHRPLRQGRAGSAYSGLASFGGIHALLCCSAVYTVHLCDAGQRWCRLNIYHRR